MSKLNLIHVFGILCLFLLSGCGSQQSKAPNKKAVETFITNKLQVDTNPDATKNLDSTHIIKESVHTEITKNTPTQTKSAFVSDSNLNSIEYTIARVKSTLAAPGHDTNKENTDTIIEPTSYGEIEVIREELIASFEVTLASNDTSTLNMQIDSILSKQSDIDISQKKSVTVEFWEHPLYSSQYSMNGKVLKIYGIAPDETALIRPYQEQNYLVLNGSYFEIENSFSLRPLKAESDSFIIYQLQAN